MEYKGSKYDKADYCVLDESTVKSMIAELGRLYEEYGFFVDFDDRSRTMVHVGLFKDGVML